MSKTKKYKSHTAEFKSRVGLEALRRQKTFNEIGSRVCPSGADWSVEARKAEKR